MEAPFIYLLGDNTNSIWIASFLPVKPKKEKKSIHMPIPSKVKIKPPQKSMSSFNNKLNIIYLDKYMGLYLNSLH